MEERILLFAFGVIAVLFNKYFGKIVVYWQKDVLLQDRDNEKVARISAVIVGLLFAIIAFIKE